MIEITTEDVKLIRMEGGIMMLDSILETEKSFNNQFVSIDHLVKLRDNMKNELAKMVQEDSP